MRTILICSLLTISIYLNAQNDTLIFKQVNYAFMPAITSRYFYFTEDGLMWFSTANGITSFDGSELVYYSSEEQASKLGLTDIICIAEDKLHNLYIKGSNHLLYLNRKTNQLEILSQTKDKKNIPALMDAACIYINSNRLVFIGTIANGLFIYDPFKKTFDHINMNAINKENYYYNTVKSFAENKYDTSKLWLGTYNGIFLFDKNSRQLSQHFTVVNAAIKQQPWPHNLYDIRRMYMTDDTTIWFSTFSHGIGEYNTHTGKAKMYAHNVRINEKDFRKAPSIRGFAPWGTDKYILGISDPGPGMFDTRSKQFTGFKINQDDDYANIQYVANDRDGNLWLMNEGILYAALPPSHYLHNISIKKQLTKDYLANQLGDIFFDKKQSLYYAAVPFSSGVYVFDTAFNIREIVPVPLYTNRYTYKETGNEFITEDSNGRIWTTCLGTYILQPGANKFEYANKLYDALSWLNTRGETYGITTTKKGDILLLFVDGAIFHIDHKTLAADSITLPPLTSNEAYSIQTKHITYDGYRDVTYLNNSQQIIQYNLSTNTKKNIPVNVLLGGIEKNGQPIEYDIDARGFIWIWIPRFGVRIIDPDKLVCIDSIKPGTRGLMNNGNEFIRSCGDNCMLFIGQNGVIIYNYKQERSLLLNHNNGWKHAYDYCKKYCNGKLFISTSNEIQYYDIDGFSKMQSYISPSLNYVFANDSLVFTRNYNNIQEIKLPYDQNNITLSFSATELFFPERIEYAYQLSGVNKTWQYTDFFKRRVIYSSLSPGRYVFKLKAQMKGGNWNVTPTEYIITIMPAWWQTTLFQATCALIAALLIAAFIRWRVVTTRKKEQVKLGYEKELLELEARALRAQMNPHFIFNCMNSIKALIQMDEKNKSVIYLTTFSRLIRTIFQNADRKEISLYEEIETCRLYTQLESMRFDDKLQYNFDIDTDTDFKSIMVPPLILQPFIENAIWHGIMPKESAGKLSVSIHAKDDKVFCTVEDDGIGRSKAIHNNNIYAMHESKGMKLTQSRLEINNILNQRNATVEIIDKVNGADQSGGTIVLLMFDKE